MLLQRALDSESDLTWTYFYQAFEPWVKSRVRASCFRYGLADDLVDHFVNLTYFRCWRSLHGKADRLKDFRHALNYLRMCTRSAVLDSVKNRPSTAEVELDTERLVTPHQESDDFDRLWQFVLEEVRDEKDRLLVDCYIVQDLKPREILEAYPEHWQDTEAIKTDWQRVRRHLRRNYNIRQWFHVDDTI
jgi:hypothetical protein